ncbi:MAG: PEP-CTERM sorting domain-containing protein [Planctomycetota bacterium]
MNLFSLFAYVPKEVRRRSLVAVFGVLLCSFSVESHGAYVVYFDNNATFQIDAGGPLLVEDFEEFDDFTASVGNPVTFADTGVVLSFIDADTNNGSSSTIAGGSSIAYNGADAVTFTFPVPITAFAIDIFDLQTNATPSIFLSTLSDNGLDTETIPVSFSATNVPFTSFNFAVVNDTPFDSVTFSFGFGGSNDTSFDTIFLDTLQFVPIPEPVSLGLLAMGCGLLTLRRHTLGPADAGAAV